MTERQSFVISRLETVITTLLRKSSQGFLQFVAIITREGELGAVLKNDAIFAMKPGLKLLDAVDTDY